MNKEELEQAFNETTDNAVNLLKENVKLKNKIEKAIEYIKDNCYDYDYETYSNLTTDEVIELLNILEGSDKE